MTLRCLIAFWICFCVLAQASSLRITSLKGRSARSGLYVSPNGSDASDGSFLTPFATFEAARDKIRSDGLSNTNATVWIRGGVYTRTNAFELTSSDSGTESIPIVYRSYPGETAILSGGLAITNFTAVTDPGKQARLVTNAILVADISSLGISYGDLTNRGANHSRTDLYSGYMRPWLSELFYGTNRQQLARWPNQNKSGEVYAWTVAPCPGASHEAAADAWFTYREAQPSSWLHEEDIWVHGYWSYRWNDSFEKVVSIGSSTNAFLTDKPGDYGFSSNVPYEVLNVLETLDSPGEWVLDRTNNLVYFWPPDANVNVETTISALGTNLVTMDNVDYVTFQGIVFQSSRGSGISLISSDHNRIQGCTFRNLGNCGVVVGNALFNAHANTLDITHDYEGGTDNQIVGCQFFNIGEGGVAVSGGSRETLTPALNVVSNCYFRAFNVNQKCYRPAVRLDGVGSTVSHCTMHDSPHQAIYFSGNDHTIEYCNIYDVCKETSDAGVIYAVNTDWKQRGTVIRYNFIQPSAGHGIYLDDFTSGVTMYGNIIMCVLYPVLIGGGRDNIFDNNIVVQFSGSTGWHVHNRGNTGTWTNSVAGLVTSVKLVDYTNAPYRTKYPALLSLHDDITAYEATPNETTFSTLAFPAGNAIRTNVFDSCIPYWYDIDTNLIEQALNWYSWSYATFTGFSQSDAIETRTFSLKADSSQILSGFSQIPQASIGVHSDQYGAVSPSAIPAYPPVYATRQPFLTNAIPIPGRVQGEDYDDGPIGETFDVPLGNSYGNNTWGDGRYRREAMFYISGSFADGARVYAITLTNPAWTEYTIQCTETRDYTLTIVPRSGTTPTGNWHINLDGSNVTGTLNSSDFETVVNIAIGSHVMRIVPESGASGRIDYVNFE